jgi:hypothetical protein
MMMNVMNVMSMMMMMSSSWLELSTFLLDVDQLHHKLDDGSLSLSDSLVAVDTSLMSLVSDDLVLELKDNLLLYESELSNSLWLLGFLGLLCLDDSLQDSSGLMAMGKEVLLLDVLEVRVLMDGVAWLWYFDTVTGERWSVINLDESLLTKGQTDASSRNNGFVHLNELRF